MCELDLPTRCGEDWLRARTQSCKFLVAFVNLAGPAPQA